MPSAIQIGDTGAPVSDIQQRLRKAMPGAPLDNDGTFGPQTEAAVKQIQSAAGLPTSGQVDQATDKAITRAMQAQTFVGPPRPQDAAAASAAAAAKPPFWTPQKKLLAGAAAAVGLAALVIMD